MKPEATNYNVPTVSQFKRDAIVRQILAKRRKAQTIAWIIATIITTLSCVYFIYG